MAAITLLAMVFFIILTLGIVVMGFISCMAWLEKRVKSKASLSVLTIVAMVISLYIVIQVSANSLAQFPEVKLLKCAGQPDGYGVIDYGKTSGQ